MVDRKIDSQYIDDGGRSVQSLAVPWGFCAQKRFVVAGQDTRQSWLRWPEVVPFSIDGAGSNSEMMPGVLFVTVEVIGNAQAQGYRRGS